MSNANGNFQRALVAFSKNGKSDVFKQAVEKYLKQFNKTVNQKVQNILANTSYHQNIKTKLNLLKRLAAQTSTVAQRAQAVGAPSPLINNLNRRIGALLLSYKTEYNNKKSINSNLASRIKTNITSSNNKNRLIKTLNLSYTDPANAKFVKNIKNILRIPVSSPAPPPLPPKPLINISSSSVIVPVAPVLQTFPVSQNKLGEITKILELIRTKGINNTNWQRSINRQYNAANINHALQNFEFKYPPFSNQNKARIKNRLSLKSK